MSKTWQFATACAVLCAAAFSAVSDVRGAAVTFVGSDSDIGGTFFSGGTAPFVVVPWRSETAPKAYDLDGNNVYGSAGYALFATQFTYPGGATCCGGTHPVASATFPNMISLPSYVTASQALVANKVGGWPYALIDDPTLVNGYRDYNWGLTQTPPRPGPDQSPYIKLGSLEGTDILGNNPRTSPVGAGRFAFTVGAGVPNRFRVGVMTDGLDGNQWASTEVLLHQVSGTTILTSDTTSALVRNRFVDIHTFDVIGAQPGDTFAVFSKASSDGQGAIAGITFDGVPEPASLTLLGLATIGALLGIRSRG